jgi:hypothetical protein
LSGFQALSKWPKLRLEGVAKRVNLQKKVTAGILRDSFVVRSIKRGEDIDLVLKKIGLTESTWEDAKIKYQKLSAGGI